MAQIPKLIVPCHNRARTQSKPWSSTVTHRHCWRGASWTIMGLALAQQDLIRKRSEVPSSQAHPERARHSSMAGSELAGCAI
jgi:hypothetical protein